MLSKMPSRRLTTLLAGSSAFVIFIFLLRTAFSTGSSSSSSDPFPLLSTVSAPPPIPKWNQPRKDIHKTYNLPLAPPLLIGFTRSWPILLQAVVSYITAGWPPSQIYVVENTGTQLANKHGKLSLQNPFFLNHTQLGSVLGVNIIQTPVLLSFAQLQNYYLHLALTRDWPYYFWSHQDVLTLSFEAGLDDVTPPYNQPGYKTVYELGCQALHEARTAQDERDEKWAVRFFAYDHLALVNPAAYEAVGGWDTLIPYYMTDCDMHSRLLMDNWTMLDAPGGTVTDTSSALRDLAALYRMDGVEPDLVDPNPPAPPEEADTSDKRHTKRRGQGARKAQGGGQQEENADSINNKASDPNLDYYWALRHASDLMFWSKHGERGRNTWQGGQHGGQGEPYHYPAEGFAEAIDVVTEAGREVYRRKWGHRDCDLIAGAGLKIDDQWRVEKDWKD
ncbi:hypothetical protein BD289DRAFT_461530 [Coniella lustricola]|uniref:Glycosyl transferase family 8 protein n=1 Tax=Coniella lustricola TaxID=2025994 RepID=A0A2T3A4Y4_9PEZI|nr:hypothetical protein BD289DRAFT_461530 [Coniella lustricola]